MVDRIEGCDISHWQSIVDFNKAYAMGIRFVGIKVSQGINYRDDKAIVNNTNARLKGILTFPYHFVTTDNAIAQYNWFLQCTEGMTFDLPPALDVEYYNSAPSNLMISDDPKEIMPIYEFRYGTPPPMFAMNTMYTLTIPSESIVWGIASRLRGWRGHAVPAIYTNIGSGNAVFTTNPNFKWNEYLLWLAFWTTGTVYNPTAWKGKPVYIWQDRVIRNAQDWGVDGDMDHDFWMDAKPFPNEPPPPVSDEIKVRMITLGNNKIYCGTLKELC